jgi:hypothetical protein
MQKNIEGKMITVPNQQEMDLFNERHPLTIIHHGDKVIDKGTGKIGTLVYQSAMMDGSAYSITFDDGSSKDVSRKNLTILELGDIGLRQNNSHLENIREELNNKVNVQEYDEKYEATSISLETWQNNMMNKLHKEFNIPKEFISFHKHTSPDHVEVCINGPTVSTSVSSYVMYSDENCAGGSISPMLAKRINEDFAQKKSHLDYKIYSVTENDGLISIERKYPGEEVGTSVILSKEASDSLNKKLNEVYFNTKGDRDYTQVRYKINSILKEGFNLSEPTNEVLNTGNNSLGNIVHDPVINDTLVNNTEKNNLSLSEKFKNFIATGKDTVKIALLYASLSVEMVKDKFEHTESNNIESIKNRIQSIRNKNIDTNNVTNKATI